MEMAEDDAPNVFVEKAADGALADATYPMIDALRGFAAISVVIYHVIEHFGWVTFPTSGPLVWFRTGWMGVDLFFVLSGFVIAKSTFCGITRFGSRGFRLPFIKRRLARIVPLHYLTCLIFIAFIQPTIVFTPVFWQQLTTHALFIHNFWLMHSGGINGVNWSLAPEMQFYILILITGPWLRRAPMWIIAAGALSIAWSWRLGVFLLVDANGPYGTFPVFVATTQLPGMLDEFATGILIARLLAQSPAHPAFRTVMASPAVLLATAAASMWIMFALYWPRAQFWSYPPMVVIFRTYMAGVAGSCILVAVSLSAWPALVRLSAPLRYLGTISYGIYLWHLPVILALHRIEWLGGGHALLPVLAFTFVLALGSWLFFENPLLARFSRRPPLVRGSHPAGDSHADIARRDL